MDVGTLADLVKLGPDSLMQHAKLMVRLENARGNLTSFLRQEIGQTGSMEFEEKLYNEAYNILQSKGTYEDYFTFAESLTGKIFSLQCTVSIIYMERLLIRITIHILFC